MLKFQENLSVGSPVVQCGQTDMTELTVTSCSFVNVPKNGFQQKVKILNIEVDEHQSCTVQAQRMTLRYLRDVQRLFGHNSPPCVEVVFVNSGLFNILVQGQVVTMFT
jgi:hypothetical protein